MSPARARRWTPRAPQAGAAAPRRLEDLVSVGPATVRDLALLGVRSVEELARRDPQALYQELCRRMGTRVDPCCEDVFSAAVAQARDPALPAEQRRWWWWSGVRKARRGSRREP